MRETSGKATTVEEAPTNLSRVKTYPRRKSKGKNMMVHQPQIKTDTSMREALRKKITIEVDVIIFKTKRMMTRSS